MSIRATLQSEAQDPADTLPQLPDDLKYSKTGATTINALKKATSVTKAVKKSFSTIRNADPLPDTFDWRDHRGADGAPLLTAVKDQGSCGCCYALASVDALANRISILTNGTVRPDLSPQDMINCGASFVQQVLDDPSSFTKYKIAPAGEYALDACNGGLLTAAVDYILVRGVPLSSGVPFSSYSGDAPLADACANSQGAVPRVFATDAYAVVAGGEDDGFADAASVSAQKIAANVENIKRDVFKNGPVVAGVDAYDDWLVYPYDNNLVYRPSTTFKINGTTYKNKKNGNHALQIVGWTKMADSTGLSVPVWIVKNQWTENWGVNGYGYVVQGKNTISIEQDVLANTPAEPDVGDAAPSGTLNGSIPKVLSATSNGSTTTTTTTTTPTVASSSTSNSRTKIYMAVVAVLIVAAGIAGILIYTHRKKKQADRVL